jgi:hypothetical protein
MSWLDRLWLGVGEGALHLRQGVANGVGHIAKDKVKELKEWYRLQKIEHERIKVQREALERQRDALIATTGSRLRIPFTSISFKLPRAKYKNYPGMNPEMRAQRLKQLNMQMPGRVFGKFSSKPLVKGFTKVVGVPFHFGWRAIKGGASVSSRALASTLRGGRAIAPHVTPGSNTVLIFLAIFYHLTMLGPGTTLYSRIILNFLFLFFTIFFIFDPSERTGERYRVLLFVVIVFEILLPYLVTMVPIVQDFDPVRLYLTNAFLVWTWFYYALYRGWTLGGFTRFCKWLTVIFWFGFAIAALGGMIEGFSDQEINTASADRYAAFTMTIKKAEEGWTSVYDSLTDDVNTAYGVGSTRVKQARGDDYYYGIVEENENEKLGVYLEDLKPSQSSYEEYDPVNVYATLRAYTLDDTIGVTIGCTAGKKSNPIVGKVYPDEEFEVYNLQEEELDCRFERLDLGTNKVQFTADFNFETIAYLKRYFVDRDAKIAATREGIDLLQEYQIQDKNPIAHYTNGPVKIGMGPDEVLVGVSETYTVKPRLAVTIDSGWDGTIKQLNEIVLVIPKEMTLDIGQCSDPSWQDYTVGQCAASEIKWKSSVFRDCAGKQDCVEDFCTAQYEEYNPYVLDVSNKTKYADIEDYLTLSCRLNVDDVQGLLGATPISTQYFYVKTRYDYELDEKVSVRIEEQTPLAGEDADVAERVSRFTYNERDEHLQYIFSKYGDQMFAANATYGTPVCLQAGMIAMSSKGDPNYFDSNRYGLFGLTKEMMVAAGYSGTDYYDVDKNIDTGNAWLKFIVDESSGVTGFMDKNLWKQYYSTIHTLNPDEDDDKNSGDLRRFSNFLETYVVTCEKQGLDQPVDQTAGNDLTIAQAAFTQGEIKGVLTAPTTALSTSLSFSKAPGTWLKIDRPFTSGVLIPYFNVLLEYKLTELEDETISIAPMVKWVSFWDNLLIQVNYDDTLDTLSWRAVDDFVVNIELIEDQEVEIVEDFLYVEYNGEDIEFNVANNPRDLSERKEICDVVWKDYTSYISCDGTDLSNIRDPDTDNLPGLVVRNLGTQEEWLGAGVAYIQVDWSNDRQFMAVMS